MLPSLLRKSSEHSFVYLLTPTHRRSWTDLLTLDLLEMVTNLRSCLDYVSVYNMIVTEGVDIFNVIRWKLIEPTHSTNTPCLPIVKNERRFIHYTAVSFHHYPTSTAMNSVDNSQVWTYLPWSVHEVQEFRTVSFDSIYEVIINYFYSEL